MFWHEKLMVYERALAVAAELAQLSARWTRKHAFVDHLSRASEGVVVNIAEGTRLQSVSARQRMLDYAVGSALECSACLDIAAIKQLVLIDGARPRKQAICEIVKMLVGLRRSWGQSQLHEDPTEYHGDRYSVPAPLLFPHERLEAYQSGLNFMRWFTASPGGVALSTRLRRQVDKSATSVILNIAEANGRFPEEDRRSFLETAQASAVKAAAYVDLCWLKEGMEQESRRQGKDLLLSVLRLVRGLAQSGICDKVWDKVPD